MAIRLIVIVGILCSIVVGGALGDIKSIPAGGTIFVGEEMLDISAAGIGPGSQIAWWAPGSSVDETPFDSITVSDPTRFSALSSSFSGREGVWYSTVGKNPVFTIKQPKISIRISDTVSVFDATGKWLPKGHIASFQIETNLHEMRSRPGVSGAPMDIIITSPNGASYSAVSGPLGSFSLTGIPVMSSLYDTGPVWYTGGIESGTYSLRAECTANRINSNNPLEGAGVSSTVTVLIQDINPLISASKEQDREDLLIKPLTFDDINGLDSSQSGKLDSLPSPSPEIFVTPEKTLSIQTEQPTAPQVTPTALITQQNPSPSSTIPEQRPTQATSFPLVGVILSLILVFIRK
jgi:hypothetical protein